MSSNSNHETSIPYQNETIQKTADITPPKKAIIVADDATVPLPVPSGRFLRPDAASSSSSSSFSSSSMTKTTAGEVGGQAAPQRHCRQSVLRRPWPRKTRGAPARRRACSRAWSLVLVVVRGCGGCVSGREGEGVVDKGWCWNFFGVVVRSGGGTFWICVFFVFRKLLFLMLWKFYVWFFGSICIVI